MNVSARAGTLVLIAGLSIGILRRRGAAILAVIGTLIGILFGTPLFFPVIVPSTGLLTLIYFGSGSIGGIIGASIGTLPFRTED